MSITIRRAGLDDQVILEQSLRNDPFHQGTTVGFFFAPNTVCNVYEDEQGPIFYLRGSKSLRLDAQYMNNNDIKRNMTAMREGIGPLSEMARANGFSEIIFNTSSPMLKKFFIKRLGFEEVEGDELRLYL